MNKKIQSALISVYYKNGLESIAKKLQSLGVTIYSTGGTQQFLMDLNIPCIAVENLTTYPSILGGRVKTLHPVVFGGILGKRNDDEHVKDMLQYAIPEIDLVMVDLYPFEETVANTNDENLIIEKIDIGGPSMIRAAAKNYRDVTVIASKEDYETLENILTDQNGEITFEQRRNYAAKAFENVMNYDIAIHNYFNHQHIISQTTIEKKVLRYGENPHQQAIFYGNLNDVFNQLNGKELSYNNLVDVDAAIQLIMEFNNDDNEIAFAIIKHTNVCGVAKRKNIKQSWDAALAGDTESAFGGVLVTNGKMDLETANAINELFFEVLIAPSFEEDALKILKTKKNRILLEINTSAINFATFQNKSLLNGILSQQKDEGSFETWKEVGGRITNEQEKEDLKFANIICKHLKSNAIALVKNKQLVGKGCGQTSRVDALRHAIHKAKQFNFLLEGAVLASDAFFPFNDCVSIAFDEGIKAFIQPGGSIRDKDSIDFAVEHNLAMVITEMRHFKH
jgi:phosphoribosylaminoimidazolecarboxamide formyltransferase/IMP cyclohydrolase